MQISKIGSIRHHILKLKLLNSFSLMLCYIMLCLTVASVASLPDGYSVTSFGAAALRLVFAGHISAIVHVHLQCVHRHGRVSSGPAWLVRCVSQSERPATNPCLNTAEIQQKPPSFLLPSLRSWCTGPQGSCAGIQCTLQSVALRFFLYSCKI